MLKTIGSIYFKFNRFSSLQNNIYTSFNIHIREKVVIKTTSKNHHLEKIRAMPLMIYLLYLLFEFNIVQLYFIPQQDNFASYVMHSYDFWFNTV